MLKRLVPHRQIIGLSVGDEGIQCSLLLAVSKEGELSISRELASPSTWDEELYKLPICVFLGSKRILYQLFDQEVTSENLAEYFEQLIPNGQIDDFFLDYSNRAMAVMRKSQLEKLMAIDQLPRDQIVSISLEPAGQLAMASYQQQLDPKDQVVVGDFVYHFRDTKLESISDSDVQEDLMLPEAVIPYKQIKAFNAVVSFYARDKQDEHQMKNELELLSGRALTKLLLPVLVVLLVILGGNSFLFYELSAENQELVDRTNLKNQDRAMLVKLRAYVAENEQYLPGAVSVVHAKILDHLASQLPSKVSFSNIVFLPKSESKRDYRAEPILLVSGVSEDALLFTRWVQTIKTYDWIKKIENQHFERVNTRSERGQFELNLMIDFHVIE